MSGSVLAVGRWILDSLGNSFRCLRRSGMAIVTVEDILFKANERRKRLLYQRVTMALSEKTVFERRSFRVPMMTSSTLPLMHPQLWRTYRRTRDPVLRNSLHRADQSLLVLNVVHGVSRRPLLTHKRGAAFGNDQVWSGTWILRALRLVAGQGLELMMVSSGPPRGAARSAVVETDWRPQGGIG